jgi:hypothetical protein
MQAKYCHQGLAPKSRIFGLEPLDLLVIIMAFYVSAVLMHQIALGLLVVAALTAILRFIKWGRLPGYSTALVLFLILPMHNLALGKDGAPSYPRRSGGL